jgi:catechol 2,3-dioxygenase-like lactoylglutathione lyase family enzyme
MPDFYQVTLFAKDVATLGGFYRDVMGFKVTYPTGDGSLEGEDWVTLDAGTTTLAIHSGGEINSGSRTKLSTKVDDLDLMRQDLKNRGFEIDEPKSVSPYVKSANMSDPEGNLISLDQVVEPS